MAVMNPLRRVALVFGLGLTLGLPWTGCGGGGGGGTVVQPSTHAPQITLQPSDQASVAGQTATFIAAASGDPAPALQWQRSPDGSTWTAIDGATGASYGFVTQAADHGAHFRLTASNGVGSPAASTAATLSVSFAPAFTSHPAGQTVAAGASAAFSAAASGNPAPVLQWQRSADGSVWTDLDGHTGTSYAFTAQAGDHGARFRVTASNGIGAPVASNAAQLGVTFAPAFTQQPGDQHVLAGAIASFSVAATGNPAPTFQWQKSADGQTWTTTGTTGALLSFTAQLTDNGMHYRAVAHNATADVPSQGATLTVDPAPAPPAFTAQPGDQNVNAGATASFTVAASGLPAPTLQWQRSPDGSAWTDLDGETGTTLAIATQPADNGARFRARAVNTVDTAYSTVAALTVNFLGFTSGPAAAQANLGDPASFSATVAAYPAPSYAWQRSDDGQTWTGLAGETAATLTLAATDVTDQDARFRVVISNVAGSLQSDPAQLTLVLPPPTGAVVLNSSVKTLPSDDAALLLSSDPLTLVFDGQPASVSALLPGDILVLNNEARQVVAVTSGPAALAARPGRTGTAMLAGPGAAAMGLSATQTQVSTVPPSSTAALSSASGDGNVAIKESDIDKSRLPHGITVSSTPSGLKLTLVNVVIHDFDGNDATTEDRILASGTILLDHPTVTFKARYGVTDSAGNYASIRFTANETMNLDLVAPHLTFTKEIRIPVFQFEIPIETTLGAMAVEADFELGLDATLDAGLSAGLRQHLGVDVGVSSTLKPFTIHTIGSGFSSDFAIVDPRADGTLKVFAGLLPSLHLRVLNYRLTGLETRFGIEATAAYSASLPSSCTNLAIDGVASAVGYVNLPHVAFESNFSWDAFDLSIDVEMERKDWQLFDLRKPLFSFGAVCDNYPPTASAGADWHVRVYEAVVLDGRACKDRDGHIASYAWTQLSGTPVTLNNPDGVTPSFYAPDTAGTLVFKVTVTDDQGAQASDQVSVFVTKPVPANIAPVARIAAPALAALGATITLDGTRSSDTDGSINSYSWKQLSGPPVGLRPLANPAQAQFTAPDQESTMLFSLTVTDDKGATNQAYAQVKVFQGRAMYFPTPGGLVLEMQPITGGTFLMGAYPGELDSNSWELPQHPVTVSSFFMATYLTTHDLWRAVTGSDPSGFSGDPNLPETFATWNDINQAGGFMSALNAATEGLRPLGMVFRLPTEAEYEYAARAKTTTRFYWGDDPTYSLLPNYAVAWVGLLQPAGSKGPASANSFGLYDMLGDAIEWCHDWYGSYTSAAQTDPCGKLLDTWRVVRSNSWNANVKGCRVAARASAQPTNVGCGFRVVLGLPNAY